MRKIVLILFSVCCLLFSASAQWTQFPGIPASANIECVRATDASHYYVGTSNAIFKTDDAGANWQVVLINDMTGNLIPSIITDVYFTSSTEAIAVGWIVLGNSEVILRTTNGGLNWSYANLYNGGNYPREQNALDFPNGLIGFSVGSNGRILKTTNGGASWAVQSTGITTEIFDVDFTSLTTGYAVGNGRILRTVNGTSWTNIAFSGKVFKAVHFPSATVGYAAGESGVVYKTTNSGASWTQLSITDPNVDFTSAYFTDDNTGYLTGDNYIYHTTTGGQYWERLEMVENMNSVTFFSAQDGLAGGDESQLYHTSNAGLPYKPQPNFSVSPSILCYDSIVNLTNLSDPNWSFEWLLNGVPFSTGFSPSVVVPNAGTQTISLVAYNGFERDTLDKTITIEPSLEIDLNIGVVSEICAGQAGQVQVYNSTIGTTYRLRNGTTNIGAQQSGNGGTLTFSTGNLSATTTLNIRATRVNSCGSTEAVEYVTVITQNPDINKVVFADPDTICPNTATSIFLQLSQSTVSYKLMSGTTTIGTIQSGNGGTITFPTPNLTANTTYFVRGTSSPLGCITNFPALTVIVEDPTLYFTQTNANPEINESIAFLNSTTNPGGTWLWNFGSDATPQTSTSQNVPAVQFSTTGIHNITLTVTTSVGCVKQLTKQIHVIDPVNLQSCDLVQYAGSAGNDGGRLNSLTRDANDNLFTFLENNSSDSVYIYSGHGDTILNKMVNIPSYNRYVTLTKHNPKGVPMWSTSLRFDSNWSDAGDVLTDAAGNIYMVYFHGDHVDDVRIYSSDGRYITIDPPINGSYEQSSVIVKFDPNGLYLWHKTILDAYTIEKISLKFDESNNLLYCGTYYYKISPSGTILDSMLYQSRYDAVADGQGGVYLAGYGFGYQYVGPGTGIPMPTVNTSGGLAVNDYITMDEDHNIYLAGTFTGQFTFGNTTVTDYSPNSSQANADVFICKINNDGTPAWIKQFSSDWQNMIRGFDVKNGKVVFAMMTIATNFSQVGGITISGAYGTIKNVIFRCDTDGTDDHFLLFNDNGNTSGTTHHLDLMHLNDAATRVDYGFDFRNSFVTTSGVPVNAYPNTTYAGAGILQSSIDCLYSIPEIPPVSAFTSASSVCTDTELSFTDASSNVPSSWSWTFQGGTPATSTDQNPEVSFAAPGTHTVTLTTSNQFGIGTTATHQITVNVAGDDSNWISEDSLCYSQNGIFIESPLFPVDSYTYSNASSIADNTVFFPSPDAIGQYTIITYNYIDPGVGCVGESIDSIFTIALPNVNLAPFTEDTLCFENQGIPLTNGTPAGGTFTDNFSSTISGNVLFPPANALNSMLEVYYSYTDPMTGCTNFDYTTIYLDECLGLTDLSATAPQLATLVDGKKFQILNMDSKFEGSVVDSRGQKVMNLVNQNTIDLEPFAPGVYFVRVSVGSNSYAFKMNRY